MGALAYLEWRYAYHRAAALFRSPARLLIWIPYAGLFIFAFYGRIAHFSPAVASPAGAIPKPGALCAGFAALLGLTIARSASSRAIAFRSRAEGVLLSNARLDPLTIVVWLQLRRVASAPLRLLGGVVYLLAFASPASVGIFGFIRAVLAIVLLGALLSSISLPAFLLAARGRRTILQTTGYGMLVLGGAVAFVEQRDAALAARIPIDLAVPARLVEAGDPLALAGLLCIVGATVLSIASLGEHAFADLYAASLETSEGARRSERLSTADRKRYAFGAPSKPAAIPSGAFVLLWMDWLAFERGRGSRGSWIAAWVASFAAGIGIALERSRFDDVTLGPGIALGIAVIVLVLGPAFASAGLAALISKPLFWLGNATLRSRLIVWTAARSWRGGLLLGLAPTCNAFVANDVAMAILAVPLATLAFWSLQTLGVALYALLPNPLDTRGPMAVGRVFIAAFYVSPAAIAGITLLVAFGSAALAALGATLLLALEGYGCIALAAYRLSEFGATLATIAREA